LLPEPAAVLRRAPSIGVVVGTSCLVVVRNVALHQRRQSPPTPSLRRASARFSLTTTTTLDRQILA
jgi:hypothetical protein